MDRPGLHEVSRRVVLLIDLAAGFGIVDFSAGAGIVLARAWLLS